MADENEGTEVLEAPAQEQEAAPKSKSPFRKGRKVQYRHGRGWSTGVIAGVNVDNETLQLTTKNGAVAIRPMAKVKFDK